MIHQELVFVYYLKDKKRFRVFFFPYKYKIILALFIENNFPFFMKVINVANYMIKYVKIFL